MFYLILYTLRFFKIRLDVYSIILNAIQAYIVPLQTISLDIERGLACSLPVSYTHLTLPTNGEV